MIWGFLPPGVLVAPLRSWHAAPSRDETVPLASYQRPADWGHVSARLSVNKCSSLPSPSLGLFALSLSSASCLSHLTLWLSIPLVSSLLCCQTLLLFFPSLFLDCLTDFICSLVLFLLNNPLFLCLLFLALSETLQPVWLAGLMSDVALTVSLEWGEANADQSFIIASEETTLTNHSTSRLLSERDSKSLQFHNSTQQKSHSELCQKTFCQKIISPHHLFHELADIYSLNTSRAPQARVSQELQGIGFNC